MENYIRYTSVHSGKHEGKKHIIIVGAGIVGVCIAYFLTTHESFDKEKYHVTIIESKRVAGGASGKAGGLLALWAFPQQLVPLSFQLHKELSEKYDGDTQWDYRKLTTISLEGDILKSLKNKTEYSQKNSSNTSEDREILANEDDDTDSDVNSTDSMKKYKAEENGGDDKSSHTDISTHDNINSVYEDSERNASSSSSSISSNKKKKKVKTKTSTTVTKNSIKNEHEDISTSLDLPKELTWINKRYIYDWSQLGGADDAAQVHPYKFTNFILKKAIETGAVELIIGKVNEILFLESTGEAEGVSYIPSTAQDEQRNNATPIKLTADQLVLSMGPWTSKILPDCPISGLRAHSITILPENEKPVSPFAIFTELKVSENGYASPEMYARKDEVYVCGEGDSAVDVPETTDDVQVVKEKCDKLFEIVGNLSTQLKNGTILKRQACYLPVLDVPSNCGPLIGETNVPKLYIASGHSCWGINNAPGTGRVMAELLLEDEVKSADISALDPSLFFDATIWE